MIKKLLIITQTILNVIPYNNILKTEDQELNSFIVELKEDLKTDYIENLMSNYNWYLNYKTLDFKEDFSSFIKVYYDNEFSEKTIYNDLINNEFVVNLEKNEYLDFGYDEFKYLNNVNLISSSDTPYWYESINLNNAWKIIKDVNNLKVGIIDSGIYSNHIDLKGVVDEPLSYSVTGNKKDAYNPEEAHGTKVAGIIGALHNDLYIDGVCENIKLVPIRDTNHYDKSTKSDVYNAISYAVSKDLFIVNMSQGFSSSSEYLSSIDKALEGFDGILICASGNSQDKDYNITKMYPICSDNDHILGVGSINRYDIFPSNYAKGKEYIDILAPGIDIDTIDLSGSKTDSGCSFATPMVTGAVALYKALYPKATYKEIKNRIISSAKKINKLKDYCVAEGKLDVFSFLHKYHNYASYKWISYQKHTGICSLCDEKDELPHVVSSDAFSKGNKYANCLLCGGLAEMGLTTNKIKSANASKLINGIIVLSEEDYSKFLKGELNINEVYEKFI